MCLQPAMRRGSANVHHGSAGTHSKAARGVREMARVQRAPARGVLRQPTITRPIASLHPMRAARTVPAEKLTFNREDTAAYKELRANASTSEKQVRVYDKVEARSTARGDSEGEKFARLMAHAARSQLSVLATFERKRTDASAARKALTAACAPVLAARKDETKAERAYLRAERKGTANASGLLALLYDARRRTNEAARTVYRTFPTYGASRSVFPRVGEIQHQGTPVLR